MASTRKGKNKNSNTTLVKVKLTSAKERISKVFEFKYNSC